jgi:hypothetical protein
MGTISFLDLFDARTTQSGVSRPVGKLETILKVTATKIVSDEGADGGFVFGTEVPLGYCYRTRAAEAEGVAIRRLEFSQSKDIRELDPGSLLVVTENPYRTMWATSATFKTSSKDHPAALDTVETVEELLNAVRQSRQDLFETRTGVLTAAIEEDQFRHCYEPSKRTEYGSLSQVIGCIPRTDERPVDLKMVETAILRSDHLQGYLKAVRSGVMIGRKKSLFVPGRLHAELDGLLWWSVRQALAGPGEAGDSGASQGQPVAWLAKNIFERHMENFVRAALDTSKRLHLPLEALNAEDEASRRLSRFFGALAQI